MLNKILRNKKTIQQVPDLYSLVYLSQQQFQSSGSKTFFEGKVKQNTSVVLGVVQNDLKNLQSALQQLSKVNVPANSQDSTLKTFVKNVEKVYQSNKLPDDFQECDIQLDDALVRSSGDLKLALKDFNTDVDGIVLQEINNVLDKALVSGASTEIKATDNKKLRQLFMPLAQKLKIDQLKNKDELKVQVAKNWMQQVDQDNKDRASSFARDIGLEHGKIDFSVLIPNNAHAFQYTDNARRKGILLVASIMQKLQK